MVIMQLQLAKLPVPQAVTENAPQFCLAYVRRGARSRDGAGGGGRQGREPVARRPAVPPSHRPIVPPLAPVSRPASSHGGHRAGGQLSRAALIAQTDGGRRPRRIHLWRTRRPARLIGIRPLAASIYRRKAPRARRFLPPFPRQLAFRLIRLADFV